MTAPDNQQRTDPVKASVSLRSALTSVEMTLSPLRVDVASPELRLGELRCAWPEGRCPVCTDLELGRKRAEAERDLSRVTDFNVLIVRHRMAHASES
ncbi:hypothetical protein [Streptomyces halobius]|uniref:Uncharacterized protein n=1 Tax=Streptomyces halobius TaxID=2879846 RepID=A0ABY4MB39_9ACTN|nr:hypothetical protein [Streptomyces halobius]UQA93571.1 hypothetical protein K9S39_18465 [Streptomyces halobius]